MAATAPPIPPIPPPPVVSFRKEQIEIALKQVLPPLTAAQIQSALSFIANPVETEVKNPIEIRLESVPSISLYRVVASTCTVRKSADLKSKIVAKLKRHTLCRVCARTSGRLRIVSPEGWVTEKLENCTILKPVPKLTPASSLETFFARAVPLDATVSCKVLATLRLVGITSIDGLANVIGTSGSKILDKCLVNKFLEMAGHATLPSPTILAIRTAVARLRLEAIKGPYPLLVTAPHSIMVPRDGHNLHLVESGTAPLAQSLATLLGATSVVWSAEERKKSALRVKNRICLKKTTAGQMSKEEAYLHCFGAEAGAGADNALRDPNFRLREEAMPETSAWSEQMHAVLTHSRALHMPCIAIDVHGKHDDSRGDFVVGLCGMLSPSKRARVAKSLRAHVQPLLETWVVKFVVADRENMPLCGHNVTDHGRYTISATAARLVGMDFAMQIEFSKRLRKTLLNTSGNRVSPQLAQLARALKKVAQDLGVRYSKSPPLDTSKT